MADKEDTEQAVRPTNEALKALNTRSIRAYYNNKSIGVIRWLTYSICRDLDEEHPKVMRAGQFEWEQFDTEPFIDEHATLMFDGPDMYDDLRPDAEQAKPWYPDQIPPFDVHVIFNDNTERWLRGVELLNNGCYGVGTDDIVADHVYQFIFQSIDQAENEGYIPNKEFYDMMGRTSPVDHYPFEPELGWWRRLLLWIIGEKENE